MSSVDSAAVDALIGAVHASAKYATISADLVRVIGQRELAARRSFKEAVKATKNKLHQVAGAYLDTRPPYAAWLRELTAAQADPVAFRAACARMLAAHASTRERLPILDPFYTTTLASIAPVRAVLDVACGLNPLALHALPLAADATYAACDLYGDMAAFIGAFFALAGVRGESFVCDVVSAPPTQPADLALVLKVLPPLEQIERGAGLRLLRALNVPHMLVTFPAQSLGGRGKGMAENYERQFRALIAPEGWRVQQFLFATELAFLVSKNADA